jgi:hypothetical protein
MNDGVNKELVMPYILMKHLDKFLVYLEGTLHPSISNLKMEGDIIPTTP